MADYLPDTFLLQTFAKLDAQDRISSSQVCPNWYHRVREVNQAVRCFTIVVGHGRFDKDWLRDNYTFKYSLSIKQELKTMDETEKNKEDREKLECSTKKNTLHFCTSTGLELTSTTVQQIIDAFPATTELNFFNQSGSMDNYKYLVQMLETGDQDSKNGWGHQLTALRLIDLTNASSSTETSQRLFDAINRLPVLIRLVIRLCNEDERGLQMQALPILARLKEMRFEQFLDENLIAFLSSVQSYAAENAHFQIDLPNGLEVLKRLLEPLDTSLLNQSTREKITRITLHKQIDNLADLSLTCTSFPNLTSLHLLCSSRELAAPMFDLISRNLPHLRHLRLCIYFPENIDAINENAGDVHENFNNIPPISRRPSAPITSLKVLELCLGITSHYDLQWLNLSVTAPNLQVIHFSAYHCLRCDIKTHIYYFKNDKFVEIVPEQAAVRGCFEAVLPGLSLSTKVPLERITLDLVTIRSTTTVTAKQMLAQLSDGSFSFRPLPPARQHLAYRLHQS